MPGIGALPEDALPLGLLARDLRDAVDEDVLAGGGDGALGADAAEEEGPDGEHVAPADLAELVRRGRGGRVAHLVLQPLDDGLRGHAAGAAAAGDGGGGHRRRRETLGEGGGEVGGWIGGG